MVGLLMTDAAKIARGLTKAQREAVGKGYAWSGHTRLALWKLKMIESLHDGYEKPYYYSSPRYKFRLTPLGLAVRAELERIADE